VSRSAVAPYLNFSTASSITTVVTGTQVSLVETPVVNPFPWTSQGKEQVALALDVPTLIHEQESEEAPSSCLKGNG